MGSGMGGAQFTRVPRWKRGRSMGPGRARGRRAELSQKRVRSGQALVCHGHEPGKRRQWVGGSRSSDPRTTAAEVWSRIADGSGEDQRARQGGNRAQQRRGRRRTARLGRTAARTRPAVGSVLRLGPAQWASVLAACAVAVRPDAGERIRGSRVGPRPAGVWSRPHSGLFQARIRWAGSVSRRTPRAARERPARSPRAGATCALHRGSGAP